MSIGAIHRAGDRDLLIELDSLDSVLALNSAVVANPLNGQQDVLAAAQTVMIKFDTPEQARLAASLLPGLPLGTTDISAGKMVRIPVTYDGEDLDEIAKLTSMSREALIAAHLAQRWTAAFGGFAPGFAYLVGENQRLAVPRRSTPRTRVPAGAVALGGDYCAVYPRQSPGGWQLLGHTDLQLWDVDRDQPALIRPQDTVEFTLAASRIQVSGTRDTPQAAKQTTPAATVNGLRIVDPGLQSLLQDAGRHRRGNLGVPVSGAADISSFHQANRLVGNPVGTAVIENLTGRLEIQAIADQVMAVTGAQPEIWITPAPDDEQRSVRQVSPNAPFVLLHGERLRLEPTGHGLRSYVAVRGVFTVADTLGSLSTDTLSGLGPEPLAAGQVLGVQPPNRTQVVGAPEPSTLPIPDAQGVYTLRVIPGPRDDWFGAAGLERFTGQEWSVSSDSNRVGIRLDTQGLALERTRDGELSSEGVARGSLQVPPSGLPVLFLADHPVTGGYPVIATLISEDLSAAAQLPVGSKLRFAVVSAHKDLTQSPGLPTHFQG